MSIAFLVILIVTWAVVIFSLGLLFVFGGGQVVPITATETEIDNAFNDATGNDELAEFVSGFNQDEMSAFVDSLPAGPPRIKPRGTQVDGRSSNFNQRRIAL